MLDRAANKPGCRAWVWREDAPARGLAMISLGASIAGIAIALVFAFAVVCGFATRAVRRMCSPSRPKSEKPAGRRLEAGPLDTTGETTTRRNNDAG